MCTKYLRACGHYFSVPCKAKCGSFTVRVACADEFEPCRTCKTFDIDKYDSTPAA